MPEIASNRPLEGLSILIVEDDYIQSDGIDRCVCGAGASVLGPADSKDMANRLLAEREPDLAVVDVNLGDGPSFDLAHELARLKVPFLFVSGYDCQAMPPEFGDIECLQKPFCEHELIRALTKAAGRTQSA